LAEFFSFIVFDPFVDLFITLCIVVNTMFMALDHHDMDPGMESALQHGNYVSYPILKGLPNYSPSRLG
jgi:voltage-gated sodium channel type II alpha